MAKGHPGERISIQAETKDGCGEMTGDHHRAAGSRRRKSATFADTGTIQRPAGRAEEPLSIRAQPASHKTVVDPSPLSCGGTSFSVTRRFGDCRPAGAWLTRVIEIDCGRGAVKTVRT